MESMFISKYGYNGIEMTAMVFITALTNFCGLPGLVGMYQNRRYYHLFIGTFTMLTSFMYHLLDSIGVGFFLFDDGHWHRLDNIGSIASLISLIVQLMDNKSDITDEKYNYCGLLIVFVVQEGYPWELIYTIGPILLFLAIYLLRVIRRRGFPSYNMKAIKIGLAYFFCACFCFAKGTDDFQDYLRFFHGFWHFFITISFFYLFQCNLPKTQNITYITDYITDILHLRIKQRPKNE